MKRRALLASLAAAAVLPLAHSAAPSADPAVAALATYEGADRQEKLVAGARKEGELDLYTSLTLADMAAINGAFETKYGIKVRMWRASSEKVLQRVLAEGRAGRHDVDIVETNAPPLESLHREGLLQAVRSPEQANLVPAAIPAHREWVASRLNVFVQAYNPKLVDQSALPKSYADLLDPKWKGKLGIEASDEDWFATVVQALGEKQGVELFREIVAKDGISVRTGHTLLTNLVASGEVPLALTVYNFTAEQVKRKGAPLDWFLIPPAVARANGLGLARHAPHPRAALLYYDFMIGAEGQQILARRGFVTTSRQLKGPIPLDTLHIVDPVLILDGMARWSKLYESVFAAPSR